MAIVGGFISAFEYYWTCLWYTGYDDIFWQLRCSNDYKNLLYQIIMGFR
jgi:hypothetical protein